jgi:hypothetical protein
MPSPAATDLEHQFFDETVFVEAEADEPLLSKADEGNENSSSRKNTKSSRYLRRVQETIELDDIPSVIESEGGNVFWYVTLDISYLELSRKPDYRNVMGGIL